MTKKVLAALFTVFFFSTSTGCIGGMAVSGKVREFNLEVAENKWAREAVFLVMHIIPVYPIAGTIDLIVVNSIEFHSGTNPVSGKARIARAGDSRTETAEDGTVAVSTLRADGSIDFVITMPDGLVHAVNIERDQERVVARDAEGEELAEIRRDGTFELTAR